MSSYAVYEHVTVISTIPLTIVGFGIAYWQIHKTRKAADAAKDAAASAQSQIGRNLLLVLLQQLQRVEQEIDTAVEGGHRSVTQHYLASWRWQAGQTRRLLDAESLASAKILRAIQQSITLAGQAKLDLGDQGRDLKDIMRSTQQAITSVTDEVGGLSAMLTATLGKANNAG